MSDPLNLPLELIPYQDTFVKSIRPYVKIKAGESGETLPWQSKVGGIPYWPKGRDFPRGAAGEVLFFLAQINFEDMPALENYPEQGLLQFYIDDKANYGLAYDVPDEQANFRLVYFETLEKESDALVEIPFRTNIIDLPIDPLQSFPLDFELKKEAVPLSDHNIHDFIPENFFNRFGPQQWEVMRAYSKMVHAGGHKIGGYAFFTQEDIRYEMGEYELLFQLDSDPKIGCHWGDMGVANFFITKEDLIQKDFSGVLYNWDAY